MNTGENIIREYDYYTLDQARKIIYAEMRHDRALRNRRRRIEAERKKAARRQKIEELKLAIFLFCTFIVCPMLMFFHWAFQYQ